MSGECCEAAIEGGTCNGCEMLDSQSSTSDTEEYSSFPQATPNRRHASLKVSHYPILLRRNKNHNKNEPASLMWTPGNTLPECCGGSTWIINEGIPTTSNSGFAATSGTQMETSVQFSTNFKRDKLPKRSESHSSPKSSRDKFFGGRSALGPRNTITWDIDGSVMSPTNTDGVMLHPQPKYSLGLSPGTIGSTFIGHETRDRKRKQLWSLSPTAFHQSFDDRNRSSSNPLSNSCGNINEEVSLRHNFRYLKTAAFYFRFKKFVKCLKIF
uniref:Uncharacterized protein n=2 Tax=Panagrolaimus sp. PS1159 TaxID=55785 RepID=A0AC35GIH6_9BILA